MMSEPKPIASLSGSLLARKGHAKPAMRPQNYSLAHTATSLNPAEDLQEDLGWNDMGHEAEAPAVAHAPLPLTPDVTVPAPADVAPPPVVEQQERLAEQFVPQPVRSMTAPTPRAAPGSKGKSAFTLRLDGERHLNLRLICALRHKSAQQIVTLALDEFLSRQPDIARLDGKR